MNRGRVVLSVYAVATAAVLFIALPGLWRSLAALAVPALFAIWVLATTPHRGAHALDQDQASERNAIGELVDQAQSVECPTCGAAPFYRCHDESGQPAPGVLAHKARAELWRESMRAPWTELGDPAPATWLPDEASDPVGHYSALAARYVQPWQQRGPDDAPHPLTAPVPLASSETSGGPVPTGGPPAADPGTGDGGPPAPERICGECGSPDDFATCDGCKFTVCMACGDGCVCGELDHDDPADDEDQAAELAWTWPGPFDQQADTLLERVRADFDLLRRMHL